MSVVYSCSTSFIGRSAANQYVWVPSLPVTPLVMAACPHAVQCAESKLFCCGNLRGGHSCHVNSEEGNQTTLNTHMHNPCIAACGSMIGSASMHGSYFVQQASDGTQAHILVPRMKQTRTSRLARANSSNSCTLRFESAWHWNVKAKALEHNTCFSACHTAAQLTLANQLC